MSCWQFLGPKGRSDMSPPGFQVIVVGGRHGVKPKGMPIHLHFKRRMPSCAPGGTSQHDVVCSERRTLRRESIVLHGTTPGVAKPSPVRAVAGVTSHEVFLSSNCYKEIGTTNQCNAARQKSSVSRSSTNVERVLIDIEDRRPTEHMTGKRMPFL